MTNFLISTHLAALVLAINITFGLSLMILGLILPGSGLKMSEKIIGNTTMTVHYAPITLYATRTAARAARTKIVKNLILGHAESIKVFMVGNEWAVVEPGFISNQDNNIKPVLAIGIYGPKRGYYTLRAHESDTNLYDYCVKHESSEPTQRYNNEFHDAIWQEYYGKK